MFVCVWLYVCVCVWERESWEQLVYNNKYDLWPHSGDDSKTKWRLADPNPSISLCLSVLLFFVLLSILFCPSVLFFLSFLSFSSFYFCLSAFVFLSLCPSITICLSIYLHLFCHSVIRSLCISVYVLFFCVCPSLHPFCLCPSISVSRFFPFLL